MWNKNFLFNIVIIFFIYRNYPGNRVFTENFIEIIYRHFFSRFFGNLLFIENFLEIIFIESNSTVYNFLFTGSL